MDKFTRWWLVGWGVFCILLVTSPWWIDYVSR